MPTVATTHGKSSLMEELLKKAPPPMLPKPGTIVEGTVAAILKRSVLIDLNGVTGIIAGKELREHGTLEKKLEVGEKVLAYVMDEENEDGLVALSLRKANREKTWRDIAESYQNGTVISVRPEEANKGGLLLTLHNFKAFIPVSQLAPMHYPRVNNADSEEILKRLRALLHTPLQVKILSVDRDTGKMILSERAAYQEDRQAALSQIHVGQIVQGRVSGIVKFGIFVAFDGLEGLVHISEIDWGHVKNPAEHAKLEDEVTAQIIAVEGDKISLSIKRLKPDPWVAAAENYTLGSVVEGTVDRLTPFGAFIKLDNDVNGLIHVSEMSAADVKDPAALVKVGEKIKAKVISIEPEEHRIGLSIKALHAVE